MGSLGAESVFISDISDSVLDAIGTQVRVTALANKHIRVANLLQRSLVRCSDSVGRHIAQGVLAMLIVHLGVLQDRDVAAIGTSEDGNGAQGQDDELKGGFN